MQEDSIEDGHESDVEAHDSEAEADKQEAIKEEDQLVAIDTTERTATTARTSSLDLVESILGHNDDEDKIDPPLNTREKILAWLLRLLDGKFFQIMGIIVLVLIVVDGALFFFMLMGWQTLCRPRTDCEPRNWIYNFSVQFLCACFTYMVTVAEPWRCVQAWHIFGLGCPKRNNDIGYDIYGQYRERDIWYHFPLTQRKIIIVLLHLNVYTQWANQVMRGIYNTYEKQDSWPGVLWVNIFFAMSFLFAAMAGIWQLVVEQLLRKKYPGQFDPGLIQIIGYYAGPYFSWLCPCCKCCRRPTEEEEEAEEEKEEVEGEDIETSGASFPSLPRLSFLRRLDPRAQIQKTSGRIPDPSRDILHAHVIPTQRPELRLWGL